MSHIPDRTGRSSEEDGKRKRPCKTPETLASKKRVQNRVAQRVFREKQAAYVHHLESLIHIYQSSNELQDEESRYRKLHDSYMKLLGEHQQLKDAAFLLKKRLVALGTHLAAAANDEIFDKISKHGTSALGSLDTCVVSDPSENDPATIQTSPLSTSNLNAAEYDAVFLPDPLDVDEHIDLSFQTACTPTNQYVDSQAQLELVDMHQSPHLPLSLTMTNTVASTSGPSFNMAESIGGGIPYQSSTPALVLVQGLPAVEHMFPVFVKSSNVLAEKILAFCKRASSELVTEGSYGSRIWKGPCSISGGVNSSPQQIQHLRSLAFAAVDVIASLGGLQRHFRDSNLRQPFENILHWRISNNAHDEMAIPEPFRPTTLQREVAHPLIVDFMNWPSVRDQMILHMNDLDLDFLCRQIHLNAVIDVPSLKVSVKIQSVLDHLLISQGEKSSESYQRSYLQDPSWTFLRLLPGSPYFAMGVDPIDAFLENEISLQSFES